MLILYFKNHEGVSIYPEWYDAMVMVLSVNGQSKNANYINDMITLQTKLE